MSNDTLTEITRPKQWALAIAVLALIVAVAGLFLPARRDNPSAGTTESSTLQRIMDSKTLRVGYEGYPPTP